MLHVWLRISEAQVNNKYIPLATKNLLGNLISKKIEDRYALNSYPIKSLLDESVEGTIELLAKNRFNHA